MSDPPSRNHDDLVEELSNDLMNHIVHVYSDVTIEGLQEKIEKFPEETYEEAIVESKILSIVLCFQNVNLDLVTYLADLAPTVVSTVGTRKMMSWFECRKGSLPLHIACKNRNCPTSVIKYLLEKYPPAAGYSRTSHFPLHIYLKRAIKREAHHEYDNETGELRRENSEVPGQQLEYSIVEMLVQACPQALTAASDGKGSPLNILCQGCSVSLELALLLTDKEQNCFEVDNTDCEFPMRCLLRNNDLDIFPTDVFRYLVECSPSCLRRQKQIDPIEEGDVRFSKFTDTLLHVACSNPKISVEAIQIITNECPYMLKEECAHDGFLPLHHLCCNEHLDDESSIDILRLLVEKFPESVITNVGETDEDTMPEWCTPERGENDLPIHYACRYKSLDFCRYLIQMHPESVSIKQLHYFNEPKKRDEGSLMLPFHLACKYGSLDLVQYLLELHPEALNEQTSGPNHNSDRPLHLAASRDHSPDQMEVINFLLQRDINAVSKVGKNGNLPLHRACMYRSGPAVIKLFQMYPAAIRTKNTCGQLPIHLAMRTSDESNFNGLSFLAQQQPDALSILDNCGMSCAHYACTSKNAIKKLELIAELCPEAFRCQIDCFGLPMHYACGSGCNEEVLLYLFAQYPESLSIHVGSLGSPLHCFSKEKNAFLRVLLEEKHRTDVENGLSLVHAFLQDDEIQNKGPILEILPLGWHECAEEDEKGRTLAHLIFHFSRDDERIKDVLIYNTSISKQDHDGWLPLHHAMRHDASPSIVRFMLDNFPEHAQVTDTHGRTPFHIASRWSRTPIMKLLLDLDPDLVGVTDNNGRTALHHACENGQSKKAIKILLESNSDITAIDNEGDLPLHKACRKGNVLVIRYMMTQDMTAIRVRNKSNELPLHLLSSWYGKEEDVLGSTEYTGAIMKLLLAYPETVDIKMSG